MTNVDSTKTVTHVSFCAGLAGIDLGIKRAVPSLRTIAFSEIEAFPCANLVSKMEAGLLDAAPIWTDLKTFPSHEFHGKVDILSAGFPCQPFSAAGKRAGTKDPRHLFPYVERAINAIQPAVVFLENVEGIVSAKCVNQPGASDGTPVLLYVCQRLELMGYRATAGIFSAVEVGASHRRKRVFIAAVRSELADDSGERVQGLRPHWLKELRAHAGQEVSLRGSHEHWPARPGEDQFWWEPSRTVAMADPTRKLLNGGGSVTRETGGTKLTDAGGWSAQPSLDRDADGLPRWLEYAELCVASDNRASELMAIGNAVVPSTVERAFLILIPQLIR